MSSPSLLDYTEFIASENDELFRPAGDYFHCDCDCDCDTHAYYRPFNTSSNFTPTRVSLITSPIRN